MQSTVFYETTLFHFDEKTSQSQINLLPSGVFKRNCPPKTKSATYCIAYLSQMQLVGSNLTEHIRQCCGLIEKNNKIFLNWYNLVND